MRRNSKILLKNNNILSKKKDIKIRKEKKTSHITPFFKKFANLFIRICFFVCLFLILPALVYLSLLKFIKIAEINCLESGNKCSDDLEQNLQRYANKSYSFAKKGLINYLKDDVSVTSYLVKYQFPNILRVEIARNESHFLLFNDKNQFAQTDIDGKVLSDKQKEGIMKVETNIDLPKKNNYLEQKYIHALALLNRLSSYYADLSPHLMQDYLVIKIDKYTFLLPLEGDEEIISGKVMLTHSQLNTLGKESTIDKTKEAKKLDEICKNGCIVDLRFKNPVIKSNLDANI